MYIYSQGWGNPKWLDGLVPCTGDTDQNAFYGPNIFNIKVFTNLIAKDAYDTGSVMSTPVVQRLINSFSTFAAYATTVIFDIAGISSDLKDDMNTFNDQLSNICQQLRSFNFVYKGKVDSNSIDINQYLTQLITDHYNDPAFQV